MEPRIGAITIGVDDLDAAVKFYRDGLGFRTEGIIGTEFEHGAAAFFDLQRGVKLCLFSRNNIAHDAGIPVNGRSSTEFTLGHNVGSEGEVDTVMRKVADAGAPIVKPAQKTFWGGYAGYFQDLDGHLWEVLFNPGFLPEE
jgi:uncharacterized protein